MALSPTKIQEAVLAGIAKKIRDGKSTTAADQKFLQDAVAQERAREALEKLTKEDEQHDSYNAEEDLEEWTLRDGVVRDRKRSLGQLSAMHNVSKGEMEKILWKTQRRILARFAFEGSKKTGPLSGNEALALNWAKSIQQISRASREWELQMEDLEAQRLAGKASDVDRFTMLVATVSRLSERRDSLVLKIRELGRKERKEGGKEGKGGSFEIVVESKEWP